MKNYEYKVWFANSRQEVVYAFNYVEAKILAQAKQIRKGHSHGVLQIDLIHDNGKVETVWAYSPPQVKDSSN